VSDRREDCWETGDWRRRGTWFGTAASCREAKENAGADSYRGGGVTRHFGLIVRRPVRLSIAVDVGTSAHEVSQGYITAATG
jgi:hypothetical protein